MHLLLLSLVLLSPPQEQAPGGLEQDMYDIVSKRTPPLPLHEHNAPPPWLSVLFLLEERQKEQGYTGCHINGACHAR